MIDPRYDFQLLLEGEDLDEDDINDYIRSHFEGEELLVVGDDELITKARNSSSSAMTSSSSSTSIRTNRMKSSST